MDESNEESHFQVVATGSSVELKVESGSIKANCSSGSSRTVSCSTIVGVTARSVATCILVVL